MNSKLICTLTLAAALFGAVTTAHAYSTTDYTQDGLLHQWDAIANVNSYTHDAGATVWKDLAGSLDSAGPIDLTLTANGSWGDNWLNVNGCSATGHVASATIGTMEVVYRMTEDIPGNSPRLAFHTGNNAYAVNFYYHTSQKKHWILSQCNYSWQKYSVITLDKTADVIAALEPVEVFYLDNVKKSYDTIPSQLYAGVNPVVMIGAATTANANSWTGRIYSVRLYNRRLTATEIAQHYEIDRARFFSQYPANSIGVTAYDERFGNPQPSGYGAYRDRTMGQSYTITSELITTNAAKTTYAECDGWELYHGDAASPFRTSNDSGESKLSCTITFTGDEIIKWKWKNRSYLVRATGLHATPDKAEQWVTHGESVTLKATPDAGYAVGSWDGDFSTAGDTLTIASVENALTVRACGILLAPGDAEDVRYVSPSGSDDNDGTTWAKAFKTPEAAVTSLTNATKLTYVLIAPGVYRTTKTLSMAKPIRVKGCGASETILDGGLNGYRGAVLSHAQSGLYDLTLRRFQRKGNGTGVYMSKGEVRRCVISDCHTNGEEGGWDSGHGGGASVNGGTMGECEITACTTLKGHGKGNALYISGSGVVTNCYIHHNNGGYAHSSTTEGAGGIYMLGGTLVGCKVQNNYRSSIGGIWMNNKDAKVINCLITGNTGDCNGAGIYQANGQVVNCTVYGNVLASDASGYSGLRLLGGSAQNNIVWGNGPDGTPGGSCAISSGKTFDHNVIDLALAAYADNYVADPKFVDAAGGDFRIASRASKAYQNGEASVAPAIDITGAARNAEKPDIGAYAYDASIETYAVNLDVDAECALGTTVTPKAVISGAEEAECTLSWTLDGVEIAGATGVSVDLKGLAAGRHEIAVFVTHGVRGQTSDKATIAVKPFDVHVNTFGSGTFPYDTALKGTNDVVEAYNALWYDSSHTSTVTIAEGTYSLTGPLFLKAPIRVSGKGAAKTHLVKAFADGTAILMQHKDALVEGITLRGNNSGTAFSIAPGTLRDSTVSNFVFNASGVYGVGATISGGLISGCLFDTLRNSSNHSRGGGVYITGGTVSNCVIRSCAAGGYSGGEAYGGGGAYISGGKLTDSRIENCGFNTSISQPGSALRIEGNDLTVERCAFIKNFAPNSFVFHLRRSASSMVRPTFRDSLIADNTGTLLVVGAMYNGEKVPYHVNLVNLTVMAPENGGSSQIYGGDVLNCVFDGPSNKWTFASTAVVSNTCCRTLKPGENGNLATDPRFRAGARDGRLSYTSPCIDAGDWRLIGATREEVKARRDQRGQSRLAGQNVDMGCCENTLQGLTILVK